MFYFDRGLFLSPSRLAIDVPRRQACGFISHAHGDHSARHELVLCTPPTARLIEHLYGRRNFKLLPFGQAVEWADVRLTCFPAGHCLGSAMLLVEGDDRRLLYTGDFKIRQSLTAEPIEIPRCDVLIMESTFGHPDRRFPPRDETAARLVAWVQDAFRDGLVPVVHAYPLGKSQEVTRLLTRAGIGVLQERRVFQVSRVYTECQVELGDYRPYAGRPLVNHAVVAPPRMHYRASLPNLGKSRHLAVTGWADDPAARLRWGVDEALPLSDHADYDELLELVQRSGARQIFVTHGPRGFSERLRELGYDAQDLDARRTASAPPSSAASNR